MVILIRACCTSVSIQHSSCEWSLELWHCADLNESRVNFSVDYKYRWIKAKTTHVWCGSYFQILALRPDTFIFSTSSPLQVSFWSSTQNDQKSHQFLVYLVSNRIAQTSSMTFSMFVAHGQVEMCAARTAAFERPLLPYSARIITPQQLWGSGGVRCTPWYIECIECIAYNLQLHMCGAKGHYRSYVGCSGKSTAPMTNGLLQRVSRRQLRTVRVETLRA